MGKKSREKAERRDATAKIESREGSTLQYVLLDSKTQASLLGNGRYAFFQDGAEFGPRFSEWQLKAIVKRAPYRGLDDIPDTEPRVGYIMRTEDGSDPFVVLIESVTASRADLSAQAKMLWRGNGYEDQIVGRIASESTAIAAYQGLELLHLTWQSASGGPRRKLGNLSDDQLFESYRELAEGKPSLPSLPEFTEHLAKRFGLGDSQHLFDPDTVARELKLRGWTWVQFTKSHSRREL